MDLSQPNQFRTTKQWFLDAFGDELDSTRGARFDEYIKQRISSLRLSSENEYLDFVKSSAAERSQLIDLVSVKESYFCRFSESWEAISKNILPELNKKTSLNRDIRIWCSACSAGEEAYTIAMLCADLGLLSRVQILASDIHEQRLLQAEKGIYSGRAISKVPAHWLKQYFTPTNTPNKSYQVNNSIKERIHWSRINLVKCHEKSLLERSPFDLILCRNVLIYFSKDNFNRVITHFQSLLSDIGYLALGHSERAPSSSRFKVKKINDAFFYLLDHNKSKTTQYDSDLNSNGHLINSHSKSQLSSTLVNVESEKLNFLDCDNKKDETPTEIGSTQSEVMQMINRNEKSNAHGIITQALIRDPLNHHWHYLKGMLHIDEPELAITSFKKALYLDSSFTLARFQFAWCYTKTNQPLIAIREFTNTLNQLKDRSEDDFIDDENGPTVCEVRSSCRAQLSELRLKTSHAVRSESNSLNE